MGQDVNVRVGEWGGGLQGEDGCTTLEHTRGRGEGETSRVGAVHSWRHTASGVRQGCGAGQADGQLHCVTETKQDAFGRVCVGEGGGARFARFPVFPVDASTLCCGVFEESRATANKRKESR